MSTPPGNTPKANSGFTDEDKQRLLMIVESGEPFILLKALLTRLETAERALDLIEFNPDPTKDQIYDALKAWLKSKGARE